MEEIAYRNEKDKTTKIQITADSHPKVFISYNWTTEEYKNRVLNLAIRLTNNGVDVILDQWNLKPGHDKYAFMEQSIRDADKVLILCDKGYTEKADNRSGGVGAETQIITPDVYGKHKQQKFIPVIMETPKAVPSYLKSRCAVFYTKDEKEEFLALLQTIYGVFGAKKPPVGEIPIEWLTGDSFSHKSSSSDVTVSTDPVCSKRFTLHKGDRNYELGCYPQGENGEVKPLLWRVLDVDAENKKALLITEDLIVCRRYHEESENITWEDCNLRKWLNEGFIKEAFDEKERSEIAIVFNQNPDNKKYRTNGGNATKDRVFALNIDEAIKYFRDDMDRRAAVTQYVKRSGSFGVSSYYYTTLDDRETGWWWLRLPGIGGNYASAVSADGRVDAFGRSVDNNDISVRPALWLNL